MKKWNILETAVTPEGKSISLVEHDGDFTIRVDGRELMSTRQHSSEERLAELGCAHLQKVKSARVLIGGLGFGFTLAKALSCIPKGTKIVVAELVSAVVDWNLNPAYSLAGKSLKDPRVQLKIGDVAEIIKRDKLGFDAILMDVDNGPSGFTTKKNRELYQRDGLQRLLAALRPGGCLALWSVSHDPSFEKSLGKSGLKVEVERTRAHQNGGAWHYVYLGKKGKRAE